MSRNCPACGSAVEANAKFCAECACDLRSEFLAQTPRGAEEPAPAAGKEPIVSPAATSVPNPAGAIAPTSDLHLQELDDLIRNLSPAKSSLGSELVIEVETNRPCWLSHAGLLRFRVTNNLRGPCRVAISMRLHGQGSNVDQDLTDADQCCGFEARGDQRVFGFPFVALRAGDISVHQLQLVLTRPDQPQESVIYELPDRSLSVHVSDPALGAASPGIVISGGIHIDFSKLTELYGADIKNILNLNANRGVDPAQAAIAWEPILLQFSRVEMVESLPAALHLALPGGVSCELLRIRPGEFTMGSPEGQGKQDERPQHPVRITRDFYLGRYPVTQQQYQAVMGQNPSRFALSPQHPVDSVSWEDAQQFCGKLRQYLLQQPAAMAGQGVQLDEIRLPTEAQWEYACRAGTVTAWSFGDERSLIVEHGWCDKNSQRTTQPVGQLKPNAWGLYDMHGNLWEWCDNFYASGYDRANEADPTGPAAEDRRVLRGGSWSVYARDCRSASRHAALPDARTHNYGFRIVLLVSEEAGRRAGARQP